MPEVFLSYAPGDALFAEKLAELLREDGISVWFDKAEIKAGDNWVAEISNAIQNTKIFIPIISRSSSHRNYITSEIATAIAAKAQDPKRKIIPVLIERDSKIPSFINQYHCLDLSSESEIKKGASRLAEIINSIEERNESHISKSDIKSGLDLQIKTIEAESRILKFSMQFNNYRIRILGFTFLSSTMFGILVASLIIFYEPGQNIKHTEIIAILLSAFTGFLGSILGFYFGSTSTKPKERPTKESSK